jgi:hypothetical protein
MRSLTFVIRDELNDTHHESTGQDGGVTRSGVMHESVLRMHHRCHQDPGMPLLADELRDLMDEHCRKQRELARATEDGPGPSVAQATISRILQGQTRNPDPETLRALAWALVPEEHQRVAVLTRLREAAGLVTVEPLPLRWPAGVDRLTPAQRRGLQRVVNTVVAAFLAEDPDPEELAGGIEVNETPQRSVVPQGR